MSRDSKDGRVHIRLPSELKAWAVVYAKNNHTSLSNLVIRLLTEIRRQEELQQPIDAEQV